MKYIQLVILGAVLSFGLLACQKVEAAVDVTTGYVNNNVINDEGLRADLGVEVKGLRVGLSSFSADNRLVSYGAYGQMPIHIHNSNFAITPQLRVEQYRDESEFVGGLGLGLEYKLADTVRVDAIFLRSRGFDNDAFDGESYMFGVTKSF